MSNRRAAACSTRTPSGITSLPMPSPGMTAIRQCAAISGHRRAHVWLRQYLIERALQALEQQLIFARTAAERRREPENVVTECAEDEPIAVSGARDPLAEAQ